MAKPRRGVRPPVVDAALDQEFGQYGGMHATIHQGHQVASCWFPKEVRSRPHGATVLDPCQCLGPAHHPWITHFIVHIASPHAMHEIQPIASAGCSPNVMVLDLATRFPV
jgi:hypothetical protein